MNSRLFYEQYWLIPEDALPEKDPTINERLRLLLKTLNAVDSYGKFVLDARYGTGYFGIKLREKGFTVVGMDISFKAIKRASAIIATGTLAQREYQTLCGLTISTYSIPYLVDLKPFLQLERTAFSKQCLRFLFCGQSVYRKGVDTLMSAFVRLATAHPQSELFIIGDGQEKANLLRMVPDELKSQIILAGSVPFEMRAASFEQADVLIHLARHDGWRVVIQEAMAAGLPVISTKQMGAAVDLIEDGSNGFLIEANDADTLYKRMLWFVEHPREIFSFGSKARSDVSRYTPEWGAERFAQIVEDVLRGRRLQKK